MALHSHLLASASFWPYKDNEIVLSAFLWREVPDNFLMVVYRGFLAAGILVSPARDGQNSHRMTRGTSTTKWKVIKSLGKNDELLELTISPQARAHNPSLPKIYMARAIKYQIKGFRPQMILTSLLDPEMYPAEEVVERYHERWELELGHDEIKTETLGCLETIRSRTVKGVEQDLLGILLAYNLVRLEMESTADDLDVEPTRIIFFASLRIVCDTWMWCAVASPGALPARLRTMREFVYPPRSSSPSGITLLPTSGEDQNERLRSQASPPCICLTERHCGPSLRVRCSPSVPAEGPT